ncbi:hypothetical protein C9928_07010, partial [Pseudidiomarina aestuarii]
MYMVTAAFMLVACGSDEQSSVVPPPPPVASTFTITTPTATPYGQVFSISVEAAAGDSVAIDKIETSVPLKQIDTDNESSFSFIAPALTLADESFTISLTDAEGNKKTVTIENIDDTDTSKLVDLSRPYPFSNSNTGKYDHYR